MKTDETKSRLGESAPKPDPVKEWSEQDKRALELSGEIEHQQGKQKEETAEGAERLKGGEA